jgi:hypothetical protein
MVGKRELRFVAGAALSLLLSFGCTNTLLDAVKGYVNAAANGSNPEGSSNPNPSTASVTWSQADTGFVSTVIYDLLAIGQGRADDTRSRVYAASTSSSSGSVYELDYNSGTWTKTDITGGSSPIGGSASGMVVAKIGTGATGVYVSCTPYLTEYVHHSTWDSVSSSSWIYAYYGLSAGEGHNDGLNMLYLSNYDGLTELQNDYEAWTTTLIPETDYAYGSAVSKARQDGTSRLYVIISSSDYQVYEYEWGGSWALKGKCGTLSGGQYSGYISIDSICRAVGRNDGVERLYVWSSDGYSGGIYELSYNNSSSTWEYTNISTTIVAYSVAFGNGRNDGAIRLYAATDQGVGEYTYSNSAWSRTSIAHTSPVQEISAVAVGDGRGDGAIRIYATAADQKIYEFTCQ